VHILIVTAHPDTKAYTHAAIARFVAGLETVPGTTHEILNLSQHPFDPRFGSRDNDVFNGRAEAGPDILAEQERVDRADALVLLFPVYWWSMPAALKGWIDRVFISGWAFVDTPGEKTVRLLGRLKGRIIGVGGVDLGTYERRGYLDAMKAQLVQGIFGYCGMESLGIDLILPIDPDGAAKGLQDAFDLGRRTALGTA